VIFNLKFFKNGKSGKEGLNPESELTPSFRYIREGFFWVMNYSISSVYLIK
jgi:hypothetical protein